MKGAFQERKYFLPILILLAGLLPSAWLLFELRDTPQFAFARDYVMYMGAARSLAQDGAYRESALPGDPWQTKYPPGYPLMLAGILKLNPTRLNFWVVAHACLWLAAASVILAWALLRTGLTGVQAATVSALWAANPAASNVAIVAMADAPYCAALFLGLGLTLRLDKNSSRKALIAGVILGASSLIKTAAVIAIVAVVAWLLWTRSVRTALWLGVPACIPPGAWALWSRAHRPPMGGPTAEYYFDYAGRWLGTIHRAGLVNILVGNIRPAFESLGQLMIPFGGMLPYVGLVVLLSAGLARFRGGPIVAASLATLAFQLAWNWPPNGRFLLPVAPAFLASGVMLMSSRPAAFRILILAFIACADIYSERELERIYASQKDSPMLSAYQFIDAELSRDAVIMGDDRVWLNTGRPSVEIQRPMEYFYRQQAESETVFFDRYMDIAHQFGASYILAKPGDGIRGDIPLSRSKQLLDSINADPSLERIFSRGGIEIFRIR